MVPGHLNDDRRHRLLDRVLGAQATGNTAQMSRSNQAYERAIL